MEPTSAQCRTQEAIQWERAKDEPLENVRIIALRAAIAWGQAAVAAERREARGLRAKVIAEMRKVDDARIADDDEKAFIQNREDEHDR